MRKLGKEAEGLVESGTIFRHVEFSFVMGGSRSPPRNAAGAPCPGHDGLVVTIPRAPLVGKPAQQRGHVGEVALARRRIIIYNRSECRCAGAAIHNHGGDVTSNAGQRLQSDRRAGRRAAVNAAVCARR